MSWVNGVYECINASVLLASLSNISIMSEETDKCMKNTKIITGILYTYRMDSQMKTAEMCSSYFRNEIK
jgi:hypothetical protein